MRNPLVGQNETWDGWKFEGMQFAETTIRHKSGNCKEGNPSVWDGHLFSQHRSLGDWADKVQCSTAKM